MTRRSLGLFIVAAAAVACQHQPPSTTSLDLRVTADGAPIAARVLLVDDLGNPVRIGRIDLYGQRQGAAACVFAPGVTGTWDGIVVAAGSADIPVGDDGLRPVAGDPVRPLPRRGVARHRLRALGGYGRSVSRARPRRQLPIALESARGPHGGAASRHARARARLQRLEHAGRAARGGAGGRRHPGHRRGQPQRAGQPRRCDPRAPSSSSVLAAVLRERSSATTPCTSASIRFPPHRRGVGRG